MKKAFDTCIQQSIIIIISLFWKKRQNDSSNGNLRFFCLSTFSISFKCIYFTWACKLKQEQQGTKVTFLSHSIHFQESLSTSFKGRLATRIERPCTMSPLVNFFSRPPKKVFIFHQNTINTMRVHWL